MKPTDIRSLISHLESQAKLAKAVLQASASHQRAYSGFDADVSPNIHSALHKLGEIQRRLGQARKAYDASFRQSVAKGVQS